MASELEGVAGSGPSKGTLEIDLPKDTSVEEEDDVQRTGTWYTGVFHIITAVVGEWAGEAAARVCALPLARSGRRAAGPSCRRVGSFDAPEPTVFGPFLLQTRS